MTMAHAYRSKARYGNSFDQSPFPEQIKFAREKSRLSMRQAAKLIINTETRWASWESGERRMHPQFWMDFLLKTDQITVDEYLDAIQPTQEAENQV